MYKFSLKKLNISEFKVYKENIAYKDNTGLRNKSIFLNNNELTCVNITGFSFYKEYLYFSNWENETYSLDLLNNEIKKINYKQVSTLSCKGFLILKIDSLISELFINNNQYYIKNKLLNINTIIKNSTLFTIIEDSIVSMNIENDQYLWQFSLYQLGTFKDRSGTEQNYKLIKFIGIWNNQLLAACNNSMLLAVDIENGKLSYQWQYFKNPENEKAYGNDKLPDASHFFLDKTNNKLIAAANRLFIEIDLQTQEITVTDLKEQLENHGALSFYSSSESSFNETHLFTTVVVIEKPDNIHKNGIVAINRKTKIIDWFFTDKIFGTGTNPPTLAGKKLYQLTLDGTLYIFEKE